MLKSKMTRFCLCSLLALGVSGLAFGQALPQAPPLDKRVTDIEKRLSIVESQLGIKPAAASDPGKLCPCDGECKCPDGKCPSQCPAVKSSADPKGAVVHVSCAKGAGTGTCIYCNEDTKRSVVVSNNHIYAHQSYNSMGQPYFGLASYPVAGTVTTRDGKHTYEATAIAGDDKSDLAILIVEGALPVADIADATPGIGEKVWHLGMGSGGGLGKIVAPKYPNAGPSNHFSSTTPSISGDSGAGLFDEYGRLVAINCGRVGVEETSAQRGTPVEEVHAIVIRERAMFPRLAALIENRRNRKQDSIQVSMPKVEIPKFEAPAKRQASPLIQGPSQYPAQYYPMIQGGTIIQGGGCPNGVCQPQQIQRGYYR